MKGKCNPAVLFPKIKNPAARVRHAQPTLLLRRGQPLPPENLPEADSFDDGCMPTVRGMGR